MWVASCCNRIIPLLRNCSLVGYLFNRILQPKTFSFDGIDASQIVLKLAFLLGLTSVLIETQLKIAYLDFMV